MHLRAPAVTPSELISAPPLLHTVLNVCKYVLPMCSPKWLLFIIHTQTERFNLAKQELWSCLVPRCSWNLHIVLIVNLVIKGNVSPASSVTSEFILAR